MKIAGWGNYPVAETVLLRPGTPTDVAALIASSNTLVARGAGRAYGDAAIGLGATLCTHQLSRMLAFDPATAQLTVEAGVTLADVIATFLPRGFFPTVVPGTQCVTIGGMVAANVHGKNHHLAGGFGKYVSRLKLVTADGTEVACGPLDNEPLFRATVGGMGLTGIVTEVTFALLPVESAFIRQEIVMANDLDSAMRMLEDSRAWTYAVAWIDGLAQGGALGRSIIQRGEHAKRGDLSDARARDPLAVRSGLTLSVPFQLPSFTLNRLSVRAFNTLYRLNGTLQPRHKIVEAASFFFPLDAVLHWNRIYGARGFVQHQCVLPLATSRDGLREILDLVSRLGSPSFLAVLKLLGPDDAGLLAFPIEGYTLALDFPASASGLALAERLDRCVAKHGGRLYLAKDACQDRGMMQEGYPNLRDFHAFRESSGAAAKFRSLQSERLGL